MSCPLTGVILHISTDDSEIIRVFQKGLPVGQDIAVTRALGLIIPKVPEIDVLVDQNISGRMMNALECFVPAVQMCSEHRGSEGSHRTK